MAKGSMSDVVQKPCNSHIFFNKRSRRALVTKDFLKRRIKMFCKFSRHMHSTKRVLKTAMFSRRIDPAGALQLINVAQSLHPRGVDECFFGYFRFVQRYCELNVTVDGVRNQSRSLVFGVGELRHEFSDFKDQLCGPLITGLLHSALVRSDAKNLLINLVAIGVDLLAAYFRLHQGIFYLPDVKFLQQIAASLVEI